MEGKGDWRLVAEGPGRPRLAVIGGCDRLGEMDRFAFDQGAISDRRLVDDGDADDKTVLDLDMHRNEIGEDDTAACPSIKVTLWPPCHSVIDILPPASCTASVSFCRLGTTSSV